MNNVNYVLICYEEQRYRDSKREAVKIALPDAMIISVPDKERAISAANYFRPELVIAGCKSIAKAIKRENHYSPKSIVASGNSSSKKIKKNIESILA